MRWVKIFKSAQEANARLPENKPQLLVVGDQRICLVKHKDYLYAVSNTCTHNGESLNKGQINYAGEVVCPWHGYQFNLQTGREYLERSADLETFPIRVEEDGLYLGL